MATNVTLRMDEHLLQNRGKINTLLADRVSVRSNKSSGAMFQIEIAIGIEIETRSRCRFRFR
jgi:hypothetical protein